MGARRKFTAEYKREAVAMLDVPADRLGQIWSRQNVSLDQS